MHFFNFLQSPDLIGTPCIYPALLQSRCFCCSFYLDLNQKEKKWSWLNEKYVFRIYSFVIHNPYFHTFNKQFFFYRMCKNGFNCISTNIYGCLCVACHYSENTLVSSLIFNDIYPMQRKYFVSKNRNTLFMFMFQINLILDISIVYVDSRIYN